MKPLSCQAQTRNADAPPAAAVTLPHGDLPARIPRQTRHVWGHSSSLDLNSLSSGEIMPALTQLLNLLSPPHFLVQRPGTATKTSPTDPSSMCHQNGQLKYRSDWIILLLKVQSRMY